MPFPDGSGTDIAALENAFAGTYSGGGPDAQRLVAPVPAGSPSEFGPVDQAPGDAAPSPFDTAPAAAPGVAGGMPPGLAAPSVDASGLPPWLINPQAYAPPPGTAEPTRFGRSGPGYSADVEAMLRAQAAQVGPPVGEGLPGGPTYAPDAPVPPAEVHAAVFYGTGVPLSLSAQRPGADGLIWKVACKTGTLALSPGPGQVDLDVPLELTPALFDDLLLAYDEKAFPYVTVPETHGNGSLENTGYVKALEKLSKEQLMADARIPQEGKDHVASDPDDTEYLLAGIQFTKAAAKAAAEEGSIPDTSIGVKFGYRNKRTGKRYGAALEHMALTPIPWVDGNIPFNPAMVLGVQPFDQDEPIATFDGVFTEPPVQMELGLFGGGTFDPDKHPRDARGKFAKAIKKLGSGKSITTTAGVKVLRTKTGMGYQITGAGKVYYAATAHEAAGSALALHDDKGKGLAATPGSDMELAMEVRMRGSDFDPTATRAALLALKPGDSLGWNWEINVERLAASGSADPEDQAETYFLIRAPQSVDPTDYEWESKPMLYVDVESAMQAITQGVAVCQQRKANQAAQQAAYQAAAGAQAAPALAQPLYSQPGGVDMALADLTAAGRKKAADDGAAMPDGSFPINSAVDLRNAIAAVGRAKDEAAARAHIKKRAKALGLTGQLPDSWNLAVSFEDDNTLTLSASAASLDGMDTPTSVEELLARQQAQIEQMAATIRDQQGQIGLSQGALASQGEQLHVGQVNDRIRRMIGKKHPAVLLAAQSVMLKDKPWERPAEAGFNLSVQTAKADGSGLEEIELDSPTAVVEFMLSAMPDVDSGADAAVALANINLGMDALVLSQQPGADSDPQSREKQARSAVTDWARKTHPERFNDDGTPKAA